MAGHCTAKPCLSFLQNKGSRDLQFGRSAPCNRQSIKLRLSNVPIMIVFNVRMICGVHTVVIINRRNFMRSPNRCVEIKEPFMSVSARVKSEPVGSLHAYLNALEGSSPVASARGTL
jgi:hypothetical protein